MHRNSGPSLLFIGIYLKSSYSQVPESYLGQRGERVQFMSITYSHLRL